MPKPPEESGIWPEVTQIFDSERVTIAEGQVMSENRKVAKIIPKTDSSSCFDI